MSIQDHQTSDQPLINREILPDEGALVQDRRNEHESKLFPLLLNKYLGGPTELFVFFIFGQICYILAAIYGWFAFEEVWLKALLLSGCFVLLLMYLCLPRLRRNIWRDTLRLFSR